MSDSLKPCPFCGGDPEIEPLEVPGGLYYVACASNECNTVGPDRRTEADAIAAWNRRTPTPVELPEGWVAEEMAGGVLWAYSPEADALVSLMAAIDKNHIDFRSVFNKSGSMVIHRLPLSVLDYLRQQEGK